MAADFTDKQIADHVTEFERTRAFPENTVFDPGAHRRGEPILRKATKDEIARVVPAAEAKAEKKEGGS